MCESHRGPYDREFVCDDEVMWEHTKDLKEEGMKRIMQGLGASCDAPVVPFTQLSSTGGHVPGLMFQEGAPGGLSFCFIPKSDSVKPDSYCSSYDPSSTQNGGIFARLCACVPARSQPTQPIVRMTTRGDFGQGSGVCPEETPFEAVAGTEKLDHDSGYGPFCGQHPPACLTQNWLYCEHETCKIDGGDGPDAFRSCNKCKSDLGGWCHEDADCRQSKDLICQHDMHHQVGTAWGDKWATDCAGHSHYHGDPTAKSGNLYADKAGSEIADGIHSDTGCNHLVYHDTDDKPTALWGTCTTRGGIVI